MTSSDYECCKCGNNVSVDNVGFPDGTSKVYLLSDDEHNNVESADIHCPKCGSKNMEFLQGDENNWGNYDCE